MKRQQCRGKTLAGKRCRRRSEPNAKFCNLHKPNPEHVRVPAHQHETKEQAESRHILRPTLQAALTTHLAMKPEAGDSVQLDVNAMAERLVETAKGVAESDDLEHVEYMLVSQAKTLDVLFNTLTRKALRNLHEGYRGAGETYLKLGMRAQSQCRMTLEALVTAKNPQPVFVGQNNLAQNQQINNGSPPPAGGENSHSANRSINHEEGQRLDPGAPGASGAGDPPLEAVGAKHRTEDD